MSKNLQISFAAKTHLAEGLFLNALLTLKVENPLVCLVGTRMTPVSYDGMAINFALKILIRNVEMSSSGITCSKT
jgi:hypothetical protein